MRATTLVLSSALVAAGLVALDGLPVGTAGASITSHNELVNRSAKSDRIGVSRNKVAQEASIHIEVDAEHGMTTVTRRPSRIATTSETDFAGLPGLSIDHNS